MAREVREHAQTKGVGIVLSSGGQTLAAGRKLHAWGSELLCYSIIANLIKNAVEASPEGGTVGVDCEVGAGDVVLRIHNKGVVPATMRERFFEKYATSGKVGGFGLGTYSAHLMAQVQSGDLLMYTSEADGTTLSLRLPPLPASVQAPGDPAAVASAPAAPERPLPALRVLVVDDDEFNLTFMRHSLPSPPLQVDTAINGRAALDHFRDNPPDVVFMDLEMPVMNGFDALARWRELESQAGRSPATVVAFSSYDDDLVRRRCHSAGFDAYLGKPATRERIHALLHAAAAGGTPGEAAVPVAAAGIDDPVAVSADLHAMLPKFFSSRGALLAELHAALDAGERGQARGIAHKLAGGLGLYGFAWAAAASRAIEQSADAADLGDLRRRCGQLQRHIERVRLELGVNLRE